LARSQLHANDPAYSPLEGSDVLPILSWLCFLATLAARQLARLVPPTLRPYPWGVATPIFVAAAFSLLGILTALAAPRRHGRRRIARLALAVNGFVLLLSGLAGLAALLILSR